MGIWLWGSNTRPTSVPGSGPLSIFVDEAAEDRSPDNVRTFKFLCGVHGSWWAQLLAAVRPVGVP